LIYQAIFHGIFEKNIAKIHEICNDRCVFDYSDFYPSFVLCRDYQLVKLVHFNLKGVV